MDDLNHLADNPRVTVRRSGPPDPGGTCVVYWMQRAQRGLDNPALDLAVEAANSLGKPAIVFFAPVPFYPRANLRHYRFLAQGIPDIAESLKKRNIGFVLRRFPEHSLVNFCDEVRPSLVVGDENPMREPETWRRSASKKLSLPLWTVDADVIVPSNLLLKEQYAAHIIRPRLQAQLGRFLVPLKNTKAKGVEKAAGVTVARPGLRKHAGLAAGHLGWSGVRLSWRHEGSAETSETLH